MQKEPVTQKHIQIRCKTSHHWSLQFGGNAAGDLESDGVEGQKPLLTPHPLILHLE
jgi:hypothetical protein